MNNLTVDNMPQKSKELGNVIVPKYIEWFANYLVVRRAAQVCVGVKRLDTSQPLIRCTHALQDSSTLM